MEERLCDLLEEFRAARAECAHLRVDLAGVSEKLQQEKDRNAEMRRLKRRKTAQSTGQPGAQAESASPVGTGDQAILGLSVQQSSPGSQTQPEQEEDIVLHPATEDENECGFTGRIRQAVVKVCQQSASLKRWDAMDLINKISRTEFLVKNRKTSAFNLWQSHRRTELDAKGEKYVHKDVVKEWKEKTELQKEAFEDWYMLECRDSAKAEELKKVGERAKYNRATEVHNLVSQSVSQSMFSR
jgi:hypothetical protein